MLGFNLMPVFVRIFLFFAVLFSAQSSWAAAIRAQVANDADIYAEPGFGSKKVAHVNAGAVIVVRTEKRIGKGGMGVFFKAKTASGKIGYITDSDLVMAGGKIKEVKVVAKPKPPPPPAPAPRPPPRPVVKAPPPPPPKPVKTPPVAALPVPGNLIDRPEPKAAAPPPPPPTPAPEPEPEPVAEASPGEQPEHSSLWGATAAIVNYSEKLRGQSYSKMHLFAGVRRTQVKAKPFDWRQEAGLLFTAGAPRFLTDAGAFGLSSGFILIGEYLFLRPLLNYEKFSVFGAVGPMVAYSKYTTNFDDGPYSKTSIRPGLVLDMGGSMKVLRKNYLRADLKVYIEQTFYTSQTLTFQFPF